MEAFDQRESTRTNHKSRSGNPEFEFEFTVDLSGVFGKPKKRRHRRGRRLKSPTRRGEEPVELRDRLGAKMGAAAAV
jgi:hypothetical protein